MFRFLLWEPMLITTYLIRSCFYLHIETYFQKTIALMLIINWGSFMVICITYKLYPITAVSALTANKTDTGNHSPVNEVFITIHVDKHRY